MFVVVSILPPNCDRIKMSLNDAEQTRKSKSGFDRVYKNKSSDEFHLTEGQNHLMLPNIATTRNCSALGTHCHKLNI